ncbi:MAG TPA: TIM barrel protein [Rubricoccaceae bacterium]|nr:TIM barrel protein [Rubricoccaceae bacterium]
MVPGWFPDTVTPDLGRAVHYTLLWGLEGVVLRTVGGPGDRVPHVNVAQVRRRLAEADLPALALDPGLFEGSTAHRAVWMNDLAALEEVAVFGRQVSCSLVLTGALAVDALDVDRSAEALREAGRIAARNGLHLAVRNVAGTGCATGEALAGLLGAAAHPAVGAAWSPADALEAGGDPAAGLDALLATPGRVRLVVVRDGRREGGGWENRTPGEGEVGWAHQLGALHAAGFDGPLALEVRGTPRAKAGLAEATALVKLVRGTRRRG